MLHSAIANVWWPRDIGHHVHCQRCEVAKVYVCLYTEGLPQDCVILLKVDDMYEDLSKRRLVGDTLVP